LGINASGQVSGFSYFNAAGDEAHAFIYSNGVMNDLGRSAWGRTASAAPSTIPDRYRLWQWHPGLPVFNGIAATGRTRRELQRGQCINASGDVAGSAYLAGNSIQHAFRYTNGVMSDLGTLGGQTASPEPSTLRLVAGLPTSPTTPRSTLSSTARRDGATSAPSAPTALAARSTHREWSSAIRWSAATNAHSFTQRPDDEPEYAPGLGSGWTLTRASGISDNDYITGQGTINGRDACVPRGRQFTGSRTRFLSLLALGATALLRRRRTREPANRDGRSVGGFEFRASPHSDRSNAANGWQHKEIGKSLSGDIGSSSCKLMYSTSVSSRTTVYVRVAGTSRRRRSSGYPGCNAATRTYTGVREPYGSRIHQLAGRGTRYRQKATCDLLVLPIRWLHSDLSLCGEAAKFKAAHRRAHHGFAAHAVLRRRATPWRLARAARGSGFGNQ